MSNIFRKQGLNILGGSGGDGDANLERATYDVTPATKAHAVDSFIYFNNVVYKVTSAISIGDTIAVGTNITADTGLDVDTQMYIDGMPDSGGGGTVDLSIIAGTESTSTSTHAYAIGEYFINASGQLCRATSAIAINDTITVGTNCVATTVGGELTTLNSNIDNLEQVPQPNVGIENVSTLAQLFGLFTNCNQFAVAGVGDAHGEAFSQLVGNPGQMGNYGQAVVRPINPAGIGVLGYDALEITAFPQYANNIGYPTVIKRKYVYIDYNGNYGQSEWKTIADNFS